MNQHQSPFPFGDPDGEHHHAGSRRHGLHLHGHTHHHREGKSRWVALVAVLVAFAVIIGGVAFGGHQAYTWLKGTLSGAPSDYEGPGHGSVTIEVRTGDSATDIGGTLKDAGVVESVDAFVDAARADPKSTAIQVGFYELKKEMPAADALAVLVDPANQVSSVVTVPEGLRVTDIVDVLAKNTDFTKKQFNRALRGDIGLPAMAEGNPEGYLFPATYDVGSDTTPRSLLRSMVDRWKQAATDTDLRARAKALGYTPAEVMTVASLVQAEGIGEDMPKVARVIYNRLEGPGDRQGTHGLLQIDATVNYALDRTGEITVDADDRAVDSPYNTYTHKGLPPGPINSPGEEAIAAATHPTPGDWYYYVTVDLSTGETKFAKTMAEHEKNVEEYREYCRTQSERC